MQHCAYAASSSGHSGGRAAHSKAPPQSLRMRMREPELKSTRSDPGCAALEAPCCSDPDCTAMEASHMWRSNHMQQHANPKSRHRQSHYATMYPSRPTISSCLLHRSMIHEEGENICCIPFYHKDKLRGVLNTCGSEIAVGSSWGTAGRSLWEAHSCGPCTR